MAHYSSKPCSTQNCCTGAMFVSYGCSLLYRVNEDVWVQIKDGDSNVIIGPYLMTAGLWMVGSTADQYTLEVKQADSGGAWSVADFIDWTPDTSNSGCCVETIAEDWYDLDELTVTLSEAFEWTGQQAQDMLGTYVLDSVIAVDANTKRFYKEGSYTYADPILGSITAYYGVQVIVRDDGVIWFGATWFSPSYFTPAINQSLSVDCSTYTAGELYSLRSSAQILAFRDITIEGRRYIAQDIPSDYDAVNFHYLWHYVGDNAT